MICTYILNIRILAKALLQIFCAQGCFYSKCLCSKKESNSTENLRNKFKIQSVHQHLGLKLYAKYQDPTQSGSSAIFVHKIVPIQNAYVPKRGITQPKIYGIGSKFNQFIYTLICTYMPNIRYFVHKAVPIQKARVRKRGVTQRNIYGIGSKVNQFIYILVCNCMPNIRILASAVLQIFGSQGCSYIVEKGA